MKIKPLLDFRNPCIPINEMDKNKVYDAVVARNHPLCAEFRLIYAHGHLLRDGEYTIVEGKWPNA